MTMAQVMRGWGKGLAATLALAMLAGPAVAGVEAHLKASGVTVLQRFDGPSGLVGLVAESAGERRLLYMTRDGQTLIQGVLYGPAGENLSERHARGLADSLPATAQLTAARKADIVQALSGARGITSGVATAPVKLTVVIDPACPQCHRLAQALAPEITAGRVQVRWVPVAILGEASQGLAAGLLASNGAGVLAAMTGTPRAAAVSDTDRLALATNLVALKRVGHPGVPVVVRATTDAGEPQIAFGRPEGAELAALLRP